MANPVARQPRRTGSFLSLRRQAAKTSPPFELYEPSRPDHFLEQPTSAAPSSSESSPDNDNHRYPFPTANKTLENSQKKAYQRSRSRTGPSSRPEQLHYPPALRLSGSSTQPESPPDTPLDPEAASFPVLVSAPVSGVETMDALVDNMNGGVDILSSSCSRFGIPNHHPLYQPPLPTPPPGIVLGGGKARRSKRPEKVITRSSFSDDDTSTRPLPLPTPPPRRKKPQRPSLSRSLTTPAPSDPVSHPSESSTPPEDPYIPPKSHTHSHQPSPSKTVAPSISDIIRAYAPPQAQTKPRPTVPPRTSSRAYAQNGLGHIFLREESEPDSEAHVALEDAEGVSRSSMDSIADEIQRTLRKQTSIRPPPAAYAPAFRRQSVVSDNTSIYSPRSDGGAGSTYASSATSHQPHSPFETSNFASSMLKQSPSQAVAQYLRSVRLTTLLKLTRSPHASQDNPLTVSLSDLGSATGYPLVVFLGLGCVRHVMGLYDEMAECLGLRLITIDRWGLGRTEPRSKSAKGIMQWASVVEEVLDMLHIDQCSVMAHSAGAPYALSFANKLRTRIRGDICLLAPWVGGSENGNYKWLKYVPNGLLKTAQAADWKLQTWMIGKPPTIAYEGIGYTADTKAPVRGSSPGNTYPVPTENSGRPSIASSSFSEYDDLKDFDGRFESKSTLDAATYNIRAGNDPNMTKRKNSRGFLERLKSSPTPSTPSQDPKPQGGRRLKALRSMSSLKSKSSPKRQDDSSPQLPPSLKFDGLGLDDFGWATKEGTDSFSASLPRSGGRRSVSFSSLRPPSSLPSSPTPSSPNLPLPSRVPAPSSSSGSLANSYQAALANALIAASHAESSKGTHLDLLQILNHDNHPWGFSYASYPHTVHVWYGDRDEKIAEQAVRWMERNMGPDNCFVKVVRGADHGLMYNSGVVVEVLEQVLSYWVDRPQ